MTALQRNESYKGLFIIHNSSFYILHSAFYIIYRFSRMYFASLLYKYVRVFPPMMKWFLLGKKNWS